MSVSPKIVMLDDHSLYLKGVCRLLEDLFPGYEIETYPSIRAFKQNITSYTEIALLISDIELPEEDVFVFFKYLKKEYQFPVLVISMHKKIAVIRKCKALNINGYILKDEDALLQQAVETTLSGGYFYSPVIESFYKKAEVELSKLSKREEQIIKLIAKGFLNKEIAEKLFISIETVKTHKKNIKLKLGAETTAQLIVYAKSNFLM